MSSFQQTHGLASGGMDFVRFERCEGQGALPAGRGDGFTS